MDMYKIAKDMEETLIKDRRWLHENPEVGFDTPKTAEYIINRLRAIGYEPYVIGKNGIVADLIVDENKKTILLRAEIDALPVEEKTELAFASTNGNMHACGHDMHSASLLGAAKILRDCKKSLQGNVKFVFQPAEEIFQGAVDMMENGLFEKGLIPDMAFAIHIAATIPVGVVKYTPETAMASSDNFTITVEGRGGHGAVPQNAVDPISVAIQIHNALGELMSRERGILEKAVLTVGSFKSGDAGNVIPDKAVMKGTFRTFDEDIRVKLSARMMEVVPTIAMAYRAKASIDFVAKTPSLFNNKEFTHDAIKYMKTYSAMEEMVLLEMPTSEADDFAYITQEVPGLYIFVGAKPVTGEVRHAHHPDVIFNEDALAFSAGLFAHVALNALDN